MFILRHPRIPQSVVYSIVVFHYGSFTYIVLKFTSYTYLRKITYVSRANPIYLTDVQLLTFQVHNIHTSTDHPHKRYIYVFDYVFSSFF